MAARRSTADRILDATREAVRDIGVRRTTFAEVARRSGVSRMTLYRHFPDVEACIAELMTREFGDLMGAVLDEADRDAPARQRLVTVATATAFRLAEHELFTRMLDVDPELLLPYLIDRFGGTQRAGAELCAALIAEGQADGSIRPGDPGRMADCIVLALQPFIVGARIVRDAHDPDDVRAELEHLLDAYLAPGPRGPGAASDEGVA